MFSSSNQVHKCKYSTIVLKYKFNCQLQSSISTEMLTCIHTRYQSVLVLYSINGSTKAIQSELTIVLEW